MVCSKTFTQTQSNNTGQLKILYFAKHAKREANSSKPESVNEYTPSQTDNNK